MKKRINKKLFGILIDANGHAQVTVTNQMEWIEIAWLVINCELPSEWEANVAYSLLLPWMRTFLALFWPSGHDRQPKMRSNLTPSGPKQNPSCGTPCWTWSKSLGSTSIRVGPRQTRGVGSLVVNVVLRSSWLFWRNSFHIADNFLESTFQDWRFRGHSSLWSFFMYGFGSAARPVGRGGGGGGGGGRSRGSNEPPLEVNNGVLIFSF